jgi:hypothetical protein
MLRRNLKKNRILGEEFHQESGNPSTFMKIVKERTWKISAVNHEKYQVLPSKVFCDGTIDHFEVFRNNVEGRYRQIGAVYLFDSSFQEMPAHYIAYYLVHARVV